MHIWVKNINFSVIFEALNFCSWSLLIFNILIIGSQIETSLLLPRRRAYTSRQTSHEKTSKICVFCAYEVFSTCTWTLLRFCLNKASNNCLLSPLWGPPIFAWWGVQSAHGIRKYWYIWLLGISGRSLVDIEFLPFFDQNKTRFPWIHEVIFIIITVVFSLF